MSIPTPLLSLLPDAAIARCSENGGRLCLSGAAAGADTCWSALAARRGDAVVHWSFTGHRRARCAGSIVTLAPEDLALADAQLAVAARALCRPWPPHSSYTAALLRRDWFQVAWAEAVYAVSDLGSDGRVVGGTAWTVQLFLDRFDQEDCPAFLFAQESGSWLTWSGGTWVNAGSPPAPEGIWAGIGTRNLREVGAAAMEALLQDWWD